MDPLRGLEVTEQLLRSIAGIDEFKGRWAALGNLAPERLSALRRGSRVSSSPMTRSTSCCQVWTSGRSGRGTSRRSLVTPN
jgi:hypothetical protein